MMVLATHLLICPSRLSRWSTSVPLVSAVDRPAIMNVIPSRLADTQNLGSALDVSGDSSSMSPEQSHRSRRSIITTTTKFTTTMCPRGALKKQEALICPLSDPNCTPTAANAPTRGLMSSHLQFTQELNRTCRTYTSGTGTEAGLASCTPVVFIVIDCFIPPMYIPL